MSTAYAMEDTQNSAPGQPTMHEANKLAPAPRKNDAQSVTKRYVPSRLLHQTHDLPPILCPDPKSMRDRLLTVTAPLFSLQSELASLMLSPTPGISAFPSSTSLLSWTATLAGPLETPYADLTFKLSLAFPHNYPYEPPTILFKTPIYHPNVDFSGRICLDILKDNWSAVMNVQGVLVSLQSLMGEPNK